MYNKNDLDKIDINAEPPMENTVRQYYFIAKCREWVEDFKSKTARVPRACVVNMGCQMNARDSEKLLGILQEIGYAPTESEDAELVIYNTCTVRENANLKVYGRLGRLNKLKTKNPDMVIALCGCMMQEPSVVEKIKKSYRFVDIIFGTFNIFKLAELLYAYQTKGEQIIDIWEEQKAIVEELPTTRKYAFKSGVNIMYGCDNFCSYCIVPYVRGREKSREPEDILQEIERLVKDGVKEVMLLGQNVNSYGKNLPKPVSFAKLLRSAECIDGLERIRFMTPHPKDLSDELIETMRSSKKICNHIHLPLQSGSSRLLKQMNRRYTKEQYLELVDKIRNRLPDVSLTTDIIVGFPGETEEDFKDTLDVVRQVKYDSAYTFLYSKRTGTPAASMEEQVPEEIAKERFNRLLGVIDEVSHSICARYEGNIAEVLVECVNDHDKQLVTGRMTNNLLVHFPGDAALIGQIVRVRLTVCKGFYYLGEQVCTNTNNGNDKI